MAAYEDSYKSLLQGVSQQVARERLDGQVTSQVNMLSDAVTGPRRRPGAIMTWAVTVGSSNQPDAYVCEDTVVGGKKCQVLVDSKKGVIRVLDEGGNLVYTSAEIAYLQTTADPNSVALATGSSIQFANLNGELFLLNTTKVPAAGAPTAVVQTAKAFAWVAAGAFNTKYSIYVDLLEEVGFPPEYVVVRHTFSYTTPDGSGAGDAAVSTPEYIAADLAAQLDALAGVAATVDGSSIYISQGGGAVSSPTGNSYIISSIKGAVRLETDLPLNAPEGLDGYIVTVGSSRSKRYYKYQSSTSEWLEVGDLTSPLTLTNMPISLTYVGGVWGVDTSTFEGRFAGDETTNPTPTFVGTGLTGMSVYQGRLVLLASDMCYLSASNQPRRFFRSTVLELLDSDPIGIGSTGTTAAKFRYAITFNKDLVLFSDRHQAILPGSNVAVTPRTAALLPTSSYSADMTMKPVEAGRGLLYAVPRSSQHFGFMEMQPSSSTDHQYTSIDITQHLPTYFPGQCRFGVSSTSSGIVVCGSTSARNSLFVHEYTWVGDEKKQQAWHRWDFDLPVATSYFSGSNIVVVLRAGTQLVGCTISPHGTRVRSNGRMETFADMQYLAFVVNNNVEVPAWLALAVPSDVDRARLVFTVAEGAMSGERIQTTYAGGLYTTSASYPNGAVAFGFPYYSEIVPTPPMRKDSLGVKVSTNKMTVLRYNVSTNKSGAFNVEVSDNVPGEEEYAVAPVLYNSPELTLGAPILGADNTVTVPARTRAEHTMLKLSTSGTSELNLVGLEFAAQYHQKLRRAQHK